MLNYTNWKRVLVAGGEGFIGKNLILFLTTVMPDIHILSIDNGSVFDDRKSRMTFGQEEVYLQNVTYEDADINSPGVYSLIKSFDPQVIVNAAGVSSVYKAQENHARAIKGNVELVANLVDAIEGSDRLFIQLSSREVYGDNMSARVIDPLWPRNVYGETKLFAERYLQRVLPGRHRILRLSNVFGLYDGDERIIPRIVKAVALDKGITFYGFRQLDFVDVDVVCVAIVQASIMSDVITNVGGGSLASLNYILQDMCRIAGVSFDDINVVVSESKPMDSTTLMEITKATMSNIKSIRNARCYSSEVNLRLLWDHYSKRYKKEEHEA